MAKALERAILGELPVVRRTNAAEKDVFEILFSGASSAAI
jgi:hypothetical protein